VSQLAASSGPDLLEESASTCSYPCGAGATEANLTLDAREGDMVVVTVVSDDLTNLVVTDSLGTRISLAVSATSGPDCFSNTGTCQADIYWGLLPSSAPDSVGVSEGTSHSALRVQAWVFSGVDSVRSTVACERSCAQTSYPSSGVLIATAEGVGSAGRGFVWLPYPTSSVAGSEYQIFSGPGTTTFLFSPSVTDVEAGAVLGLTS